MTDYPEAMADWELAVSCLAAEIKAGRKLTPVEMLSAVDSRLDPEQESEE